METREENIKKINDELEKLTDEELDDVVGGKINWGVYKINDEKASAQQNQNNNQNSPANQLGVKKAIQWIK